MRGSATKTTKSERHVLLEFEEGSRRQVAAPDEIEVRVGLPVWMIDTGDDAPVIAWGV